MSYLSCSWTFIVVRGRRGMLPSEAAVSLDQGLGLVVGWSGAAKLLG